MTLDLDHDDDEDDESFLYIYIYRRTLQFTYGNNNRRVVVGVFLTTEPLAAATVYGIAVTSIHDMDVVSFNRSPWMIPSLLPASIPYT